MNSLIVLQTITIYLFLAYYLYAMGRKSYKTGCMNYALVGILVFSIFWGLRYGVGADCLHYIEEYVSYKKSRYAIRENLEIGYRTIMDFFARLDASPFFYMGFVSFFQLFCTYYYFKNKKELLPYIGLTFVLGMTCLSYGNGMRQLLAFSIFLMSMYFAERNKIFIHYLLIAMAISMHNSAWLLIIIYPLFIIKKDFTPRKTIQYLMLVISILLGRISIIDSLYSVIDVVANAMGYSYYLNDDSYSFLLNTDNSTLGIGYFINVFIVFFLIRGSDEMKKTIPELKFFYSLFFVGYITYYLFFNSMLLQRINIYFFGLEFIIGAATLYTYLYKNRRRDFNILLSLYVLVFIGTLYRCFDNDSAFYFSWQQDLYYKLSNHN